MPRGGPRPNSGRPMKWFARLGMRHNHLTVVKELGRDKNGTFKYEVLCDCGGTATLRASHFVPERRFCTRSCALAREEKRAPKEVRLNSYSEEQMQVYLRNREKRKQHHAQVVARDIRRKTGRPIPSWLTKQDWDVMNSFYMLAIHLTESTGVRYTVDHIIPINGEFVSGLHVPSNLQILTLAENSGKKNRFEPYWENF